MFNPFDINAHVWKPNFNPFDFYNQVKGAEESGQASPGGVSNPTIHALCDACTWTQGDARDGTMPIAERLNTKYINNEVSVDMAEIKNGTSDFATLTFTNSDGTASDVGGNSWHDVSVAATTNLLKDTIKSGADITVTLTAKPGTIISGWYIANSVSSTLIDDTGISFYINGDTTSNSVAYTTLVAPSSGKSVVGYLKITTIATNLSCSDQEYVEYTTGATVSQGDPCITPHTDGCMDVTAFNYDSNATREGGNCVAKVIGCSDNKATNFNPLVNTADLSTCTYDETKDMIYAPITVYRLTMGRGRCSVAGANLCANLYGVDTSNTGFFDGTGAASNMSINQWAGGKGSSNNPLSATFTTRPDYGGVLKITPTKLGRRAYTITLTSNGSSNSYTATAASPISVVVNKATDYQIDLTYQIIQSIGGCTDESATNYCPTCNQDDGSCEYPIIIPDVEEEEDTTGDGNGGSGAGGANITTQSVVHTPVSTEDEEEESYLGWYLGGVSVLVAGVWYFTSQ